MTEYQQALLAKIREIKDPDVLNLLADGAVQRAGRYCRDLTPEARKQADAFADEVEALFEQSQRERAIHERSSAV